MKKAITVLLIALVIMALSACKKDTKVSEEIVALEIVEKAHNEYSNGSANKSYIKLNDNGVDIKIQLKLELYDKVSIGDTIEVTKSLYKNDKESYYVYRLNTYTYNEHSLLDEKADNLQSTEKVEVEITNKYSQNYWIGEVNYTDYFVDFIDKENKFTSSEEVHYSDYKNLSRDDVVYAIKKEYKTSEGVEFIVYTLKGAGK